MEGQWPPDAHLVYHRSLDTLSRNAKELRLTILRSGQRRDIQHMLELKDLTLGGLWPDWISLLADGSPVIMLDRSTEEIYRLDLQYR